MEGGIERDIHAHLKVIAVEEHITFPGLLSKVSKDNHSSKIFEARSQAPNVGYARSRSTAVGEKRLADMDRGRVAVQVLSLAGAVNSTHVSGEEGVELARAINDALKNAVDTAPPRFKAFAELPFQDPSAACKELRRCVEDMGFVGAMLSGSIGGDGKYLDAEEYDCVLSTFEELDVPLYLHPGVPPAAVWDKYYAFDQRPVLSAAFGLAGWGWHNEVAIHLLRLVLSGTLDRHPKLKIIVGHLGEMMPAMMWRFDTVFNPPSLFGLRRSVTEILRDQVWVAISGFFSIPPTRALLDTWGVDRILFAVDYPFMEIEGTSDFIETLGSLVTSEDLQKICQTNAETLLKFKV
jgi:predicted TIM-barrel fold metal-dependent hydrolase